LKVATRRNNGAFSCSIIKTYVKVSLCTV
jgi:hypothetical protein